MQTHNGDAIPPAVSDAGRIDLQEIVDLIRGNIGTLLLCAAAAVALMLAYLHHAHPVYASTAVLEVGPEPPAANGAADEAEDSDDTLKTVQLEVANPAVLLAVVHAQGLASDPTYADPGDSDIGIEHALEKRLSVELEPGSRLIDVTAQDYDPAKAQSLAQAIIDTFLRQNGDQQQRHAAVDRRLLLAQVTKAGQDVQAAEVRLQDYRERYHAVSLDDSQNIVADRLRELNTEVATARNARVALKAEADQVRQLAGPDPERLLSLAGIAQAPEVLDLRRQIAVQEAQVATLTQRYGPLYPTMIQARSQLADLHRSLDRAIRRAGALIQQSLAAATATESALDRALTRQENAALALDRLAIPYHALQRQVAADAGLYQRMLDALRQSDATRGMLAPNDVDGVQIRMVAPPQMPDRPFAPRRKLLLALAGLAGLAVGCAVAIGRRALDTTLSSVDEAETALGLPVLASVPYSRPRKFDARPVVVRKPASAEAEAFRSLRTSLALLHEDDGYRSILFTSAIPGEGKSTCSINFAASLAQQGLRTLLIDADLWRPALQRRFSAPRPPGAPGLSDCLKQPALFERAALPTPIDRLFRIGDWEAKAGSAELLGAEAPLRDILARAQADFERVVVDVPPVLAVSDTLRVARNVDVVCLVIDALRTPRRLAQRAAKLLEEVARRPATGLVINRIGRRNAARRYYNYGHAYGEAAVA